jgi:hypothetical protein
MNVHLEVMAGRRVHDAGGKLAGRLAEVHAEWRGDECIVTHYVLAARNARKPVTLKRVLMFFLRLLGATGSQGTLVVPWDKLDVSDPRRPRLLCGTAEL